jgi:NADH-quinone oxidoreductase subunit L
MFPLITHAFFKALLFLSAGSVIQGVERGLHHVEHDPQLKRKLKAGHHFDPQDMRNMGGLRRGMPVTFWVYLIGALALAGIIPLAGFWSKDEILAEGSTLNPLVFWLLTITAFLTAFYMGRQVWLVFFGEPRSEPSMFAKESPPLMTVPLMILAFLSLFGGILNLPQWHTLTGWLEHTIENVHPGEFVIWIASVSTVLAILAIGLATWLYGRLRQDQQRLPAAKRPDDPLRSILGPIFTVLENKYWIDELYGFVILKPYVALSRFFADWIDWRFWHDWFHDSVLAGAYKGLAFILAQPVDLGIIDGFANALGNLTGRLAQSMRRIQTGFVRNYALSVFFGVVVIIGYLILR